MPPGFELTSYDVSLLTPPSNAWAPSTRRVYMQVMESPARSRAWWEGLVREIVEAVGTDGWPPRNSLIAWDPARATLHVRQTVSGHTRVAEVLAWRAIGRLGAIRLHLVSEPEATEAVEPMALDVPYGRTVFGHRGLVWAYIQDYEVEVGQGSFTAPPIVGAAGTGMCIGARRIEQGDAREALDVIIGVVKCRAEHLLAFSCRRRGICPSCQAKRSAVFAEWLVEEVLLDVAHRHVVFTIPKALRGLIERDRRLHGLMAKAAWETLRELLSAAACEPEGVPGVVASLQTFGSFVNFHLRRTSLIPAFVPKRLEGAEREARVADVVAWVGAAVKGARSVAPRTVRAPLSPRPQTDELA